MFMKGILLKKLSNSVEQTPFNLYFLKGLIISKKGVIERFIYRGNFIFF